jgi:hypothetical protein
MARHAARAQALEESLLLAELAESKREAVVDTEIDGFVFSASELSRLLHPDYQ